MTAILRQLPFREVGDEVSCGLVRISVKPYQIVVWVSVTSRSVLELPPHAPRIPAILDTGQNHHFSIHERHLADWARVERDLLPQKRTITVEETAIPLHAAALWLHPNQPGFRDRFADQPPYRLELQEGIAVYPRQGNDPRIPLLGLRALVRNKLHFAMDPERCVVNLRTLDWRTKLLRWLS
jgi:hypothetical protein